MTPKKPKASAKVKYEYKKLFVPSEAELNEFGKEGWEAFATGAWVYGIFYTVLLRRPL